MHRRLNVPFLNSSCVKMWESMMQFFCGAKALLVRSGLHLVHNDGCTGTPDVAAVVMVEGLLVHATPPRAGCIKCKFAEGGATHFSASASNFKNNLMETLCLGPLSSSNFSKCAPRLDLWKAGFHKSRRESIDEKRRLEIIEKKERRNQQREEKRERWNGKTDLQ